MELAAEWKPSSDEEATVFPPSQNGENLTTSELKGQYIVGWRLKVVTAALLLSVFLANFEISVVSTSLVAITNDLHGFGRSSWIITSYLLTYTGFLIIWAKVSDILGRKPVLLTATFLFVIASSACTGAEDLNELIIFRAFQGIGGSGIYSMVGIIQFEMVPSSAFAVYMSLISTVFALSLLLGPLFGGVINDTTTWRWVFALNIPAGIFALILLYLFIPANFPHHNNPAAGKEGSWSKFAKQTIRKIDFLGVALILAASTFLVAAVELAGYRYQWSSAMVICFLTLSGTLWLAFLGWSYFVTKRGGASEPVFPWRFLENRVYAGMLLNTFLVGAPFTVAVISLPLRFQIVNEMSPLDAGIRLLPFAFCSPCGAIISAILASRLRIPLICLILGGSVLSTLGFALLSTIPSSPHVWAPQYAFQVISGLGTGCNIGTLILMTPFTVDRRDQAVALGAIVQFRMLGGAIGLAIATSLMNSHLKANLASHLSVSQLGALLTSSSSVHSLPLDLQALVRLVFAKGYLLQFRIVTGFCAAQFLATAMMWKRKAIRAQ